MYKEIVEILKCPCCGTDLELITEKEENGEIIEGQLTCAQKHTYKIFAGVIDFGAEEQRIPVRCGIRQGHAFKKIAGNYK